MRLPIDTSRLKFLVVAEAEPLKQFEEGKPREAWAPRTDASGEVLCRLELTLLAAAVGGQRLLAGLLGDVGAAAVVAMAATGLVAVAPARRLLWRWLRRAWVRRAWERAVDDAGLADGPLRVPRVL